MISPSLLRFILSHSWTRSPRNLGLTAFAPLPLGRAVELLSLWSRCWTRLPRNLGLTAFAPFPVGLAASLNRLVNSVSQPSLLSLSVSLPKLVRLVNSVSQLSLLPLPYLSLTIPSLPLLWVIQSNQGKASRFILTVSQDSTFLILHSSSRRVALLVHLFLLERGKLNNKITSAWLPFGSNSKQLAWFFPIHSFLRAPSPFLDSIIPVSSC